MIHVHDYEWIEEPLTYPDGVMSRTLTWVRDCTVCHFSPDRPAWRVIVTGSRSHTDKQLIWQALEIELAYASIFLGVDMVVVEGQCPDGGADKFAEEWVTKKNQTAYHDPFPANWKALGKRAGPYRNQQMVDAKADVCLGFPTIESRGTWDCLRRADEAGIALKIYERQSDGSISVSTALTAV